MVAFQASLPLSRPCHTASTPRPTSLLRASPSSRATSSISPTTAPPNTATAQLKAYESFLRSSTPPTTPDAPVYQTADGALVCEWHLNKARIRQAAVGALLKLAEYEKFLASSEAVGVDISRPVYVNHNGNLVCHYP